MPSTSLRCAFDAVWTPVPAAARKSVIVAVCRLACWRPWLAEAAAVLDDTERERAMRMKHARDADDRVLAYALHRLVLGKSLVLDPCEVPLARDGLGCPHVGVDGWHTSLSHAQDAVAIAVSRAGPVGIDLEHADRAATTEGIADEILHPSERAQQAPSRAARARSLLEAWVRKEAYLKASGVGLAEPMSRFPLQPGMPVPLVRRAGHGAHEGRVSTALLPALPGYVVALSCCHGAPVQVARIEPA